MKENDEEGIKAVVIAHDDDDLLVCCDDVHVNITYHDSN